MSRSHKKTPVRGMCGSRHHVSEQEDKRFFNRKMRHRNKRRLEQADDYDDLVFAHKDEVEDVWGFKKDGKYRFDPKKFPEEMRK